MSWLDQLLALKVQSSGTDVGTRQTLNFIGATVADDSVNNRVNVTISAGGITALTGDVTASGSGSVAATVAKVNGVSVTGTPSAGQVIVASSGTASAWGNVPIANVTNTGGATGDLVVGSGTALQRLAVGSTGQVLTVSGGTAAWQTPDWRTVYEVDFTAQGTASYTSNGAYTIDGQSWTLYGYGAGLTADLSAANGLQMSCTLGSTVSAGWLGPYVSTLVGSGAAPTRDDLLIWYHCERTMPSSGTGETSVGNNLRNPRAGCTWYFTTDWIWTNTATLGGVTGTSCYIRHGNGANVYPSAGQRSAYTTGNTSHDVIVYRVRNQDLCEVWTGAWSGGWPAWSSLMYRGYVRAPLEYVTAGVSSRTSLQAWDPTDMQVAVNVYRDSTIGSTLTSKWKHLRIQCMR